MNFEEKDKKGTNLENRIDIEYDQDVSRYFNKLIRDWDEWAQNPISGTDEEAQANEITSVRNKESLKYMQMLGNPRMAKRVRPEDVSTGLAHLIIERDFNLRHVGEDFVGDAQTEDDLINRTMDKLSPNRLGHSIYLMDSAMREVSRKLGDTETFNVIVPGLPNDKNLRGRDLQAIEKDLSFSYEFLMDLLRSVHHENIEGDEAEYELSDDRKRDMYAGAEAANIMYGLLGQLREKIASDQTGANQAVEDEKDLDEVRQQIDGEDKQEYIMGERNDLGEEGVFGELYKKQDQEEVMASITPEMQASFLKQMLFDIDNGIKGAKRSVEANPNTRVNRQSVANFCGGGVAWGPVQAIYQKMYLKATGEIIEVDNIADMSIVDFLKNCCDYDLEADEARVNGLKKYTNALGIHQ